MVLEKFKLSLHIGSSKRYGKVLRHLVLKLIEHIKQQQTKMGEIPAKEKLGDVKGLEEAFDKYMEAAIAEAHDIEEGKEKEFVIENRTIKHVDEVIEALGKIAKSKLPEEQRKEIETNLQEVTAVFKKIVNALKAEKRKARDLKRDVQKLRDISIMPYEIIFHGLRTSARQEKAAIYEEKKDYARALDNLHQIMTLLEKGQAISTDILKKTTADIKKFEADIQKELMNAIKLEDSLVILTFRMKSMNKKAFEMLHKLMEEGFPEEFAEKETEKERAFLAELEEQDRADYRYARAMYASAKRAAA